MVLEVLFASDGASLLFREGDVSGGDVPDLLSIDLTADAEAAPLFQSAFSEHSLELSHDERWIAYESDASGGSEVYVRPYPDADAQTQVSTNGGHAPVWAHNGREIFYVDDDQYMVVATYDTEPTFTVTARQRLFALGGSYYREADSWRAFDVASDDERFLMITLAGGGPGTEQGVPSRVIYIQNFWEELKERVGR